jgi:RNA polymerase sigma-70 factor (ECF subfamily)
MVMEYTEKSSPDAAFEAAFRMYFKPLSFYAVRMVRDMDTSKEIVHEVFIKLWENRFSVDMEASLRPYLFTAVHNRCLNYLRNRSKFHKDNAPDIRGIKEMTEADYPSLEKDELEIQVNVAVSELPERCSEVFLMSRMEGMKYREIADKLGISVKAVEAQMTKALRILRERLSGYLEVVVVWIVSFFSGFC